MARKKKILTADPMTVDSIINDTPDPNDNLGGYLVHRATTENGNYICVSYSCVLEGKIAGTEVPVMTDRIYFYDIASAKNAPDLAKRAIEGLSRYPKPGDVIMVYHNGLKPNEDGRARVFVGYYGGNKANFIGLEFIVPSFKIISTEP